MAKTGSNGQLSGAAKIVAESKPLRQHLTFRAAVKNVNRRK